MITRSTTDLALVYRVLGAKGSVTRPIKKGMDEKTIRAASRTSKVILDGMEEVIYKIYKALYKKKHQENSMSVARRYLHGDVVIKRQYVRTKSSVPKALGSSSFPERPS